MEEIETLYKKVFSICVQFAVYEKEDIQRFDRYRTCFTDPGDLGRRDYVQKPAGNRTDHSGTQ